VTEPTPPTRHAPVRALPAGWARDYDLYDLAYLEDPADVWGGMRGQCPVAHTERRGGGYLLSRHPDITAVALDPATFSSRAGEVTGPVPEPGHELSLPPVTSCVSTRRSPSAGSPPRRRGSARRRSAPATGSCCPGPPPTTTRTSTTGPANSSPTGRATGISPSASGFIDASARTWPTWSCGSRWPSGCAGFRTSRWRGRPRRMDRWQHPRTEVASPGHPPGSGYERRQLSRQNVGGVMIQIATSGSLPRFSH
jgi:hypothetical protein